jgi:ABC-type multidrug transport system fused ATPase/permease subunit
LTTYARFFGRILSYFRRDALLIASLVILIGISLAVGVLMVWPVSILVDVVFSPAPKTDRLYTAFLSHVTLVPQENALLPTTIGENIAYGRADATRAQVREAARLAGAAEFIEAIPEGYDTVVAEGGQNLSGGQRQRIAIARALLTDAPIIVLDEPTSALDPHHEQVVLDSLRRLKGKRTLVLVTHRPETVADCDRVFVLDGGALVAQGSPVEVLDSAGRFRFPRPAAHDAA